MNLKLITMFNVMPVATDNNREAFEKVNAESVKYGWIIHPECCSTIALDWLKVEARTNYNKTFYKEWEDITSKTRFELLVDQIYHYASTYGTNFTEGNGYVLNDNVDVEIPFEKFKVIMPATEEEIYNRCYDMLKSGIALKSETINILVDYMQALVTKYSVDVDLIKNKEAQIKFCDMLNVKPNEPFALLRYIIYKATGKTMLIKDKATINALKNAGKNVSLNGLTEQQKIGLASIFYRFKPLFLAMKKTNTENSNVFENTAFKKTLKKIGVTMDVYESNAKVVNELRRMAKVYHKPFHAGFWETVISEEKDLNEVKERLANGEINNFKKVTLMQGVSEKLQSGRGKLFVIRNGKTWVSEDYMPSKKKSVTTYLMKLYILLEESLVESIKDKACTVRIPKNVNLTVPTSEKNFMGNYPFGTSVDLADNHNIIGIYWRNEWGTHDFDLHYNAMNGYNYGWNSNYRSNNNNIIFSGDMTNADPEATELFYISNTVPDGKISVNRFAGKSNETQFKLFVASEDCVANNAETELFRTHKAYMCNPNNIKAEFIIPMNTETDGSEKICSLIADNKIYLMDLSNNGGRVPNPQYQQIYIEHLKNKCRSFVNLSNILELAGFTFVDDPDAEVELDLTNPDKDSLIKLFS